jgi:histidyl-tRNA synthetase
MPSSTFSTQPYKGTRDFYPSDLSRRNYIFETWKKVLRSHGFEEYETSVLENAELYIAKSGEELGGSQLYNFYDKGDRFIALRPEQTPSLARLIAGKFRELKFPLRWFSIPNCFRYEKPQKGRTREHWQLNVDIIGLEPGEAELELLTMLGHLFKSFGAGKTHFKVMYNHRQLLDRWLENTGIQNKQLVYKVLDNWFKVSTDVSRTMLLEELLEDQTNQVIELASLEGKAWQEYQQMSQEYPELKLLQDLLPKIHPDLEYQLDPRIIRGIAYYTGIVFEAFDKNPDNSRALFGGGRYDDLMDMFGQKSPAVGFGWGDLTMSEFLEGWNLWPNDDETKSQKIGLMPSSKSDLEIIFTKIIPGLTDSKKTYQINYEYDRNPRKREEALFKRGCTDIIKEFE